MFGHGVVKSKFLASDNAASFFEEEREKSSCALLLKNLAPPHATAAQEGARERAKTNSGGPTQQR
jgi:hypothetical protein